MRAEGPLGPAEPGRWHTRCASSGVWRGRGWLRGTAVWARELGLGVCGVILVFFFWGGVEFVGVLVGLVSFCCWF